jgi:hypothetical protein
MVQSMVDELTAQDILHIDTGVLLPEGFPSTHDSGGGVDQGSVHVEKAR